MIKSKRGSAWIWIIVVLIIIAVGIGIYFWLSSGDTTPAGGGALLQPPAFPTG